jgi:hypothetical protein
MVEPIVQAPGGKTCPSLTSRAVSFNATKTSVYKRPDLS